MKREKAYNYNDILVIILIASLAFGNMGGLFEVFRVLVVLFIPLFYNLHKRCYPQIKPYLTFFAILLSYSFFSILWAPVGNEFPRHALYVVVHLLLFLELIVFSRSAKNPITSITTGWTLAVALTLVVAVWEITTDEHLSMSKQESDMTMRLGYEIIYRQFASVTFYNYNTYVTYLCFAMPFLFCGLMSKSGFIRKLIIITTTLTK